MAYYLRRAAPEVERTGVGLVGRQRSIPSRRLDHLLADNYRPCREEDLLQAWFPDKRPDEAKKVVILTAHDDDLLSFCGVLSKFARENHCEVHHLILTDGSMGFGEAAMREVAGAGELDRLAEGLLKPAGGKEDPGFFVRGDDADLQAYADVLREAGRRTAEIRRREARDAEKVLGFHATYFLDYPDAALSHYHYGMRHDSAMLGVTALAIRLVKDIAPDLMVLQDRTQEIDLNPDHYAAGWIGYTIYWHLHCPVLGVDPLEKPFKAVIQRGFEGIGRPEFRLCDYLIHLDDASLNRKFDSLRAYKNQLDLVNDLFNVEEMEKWRVEGFFDVDLPPEKLY